LKPAVPGPENSVRSFGATAGSVAVRVGFAIGLPFGVWFGLLAFVVTAAALLAVVYRVGRVRRFVMEVMHRITRQ
jgi:hypothetical protein